MSEDMVKVVLKLAEKGEQAIYDYFLENNMDLLKRKKKKKRFLKKIILNQTYVMNF